MIAAGRTLYQGDPRHLAQQTRGHVWSLELADGQMPPPELVVVSTMALPYGMQCRVMGAQPAGMMATPLEPTLEDGYLWLMRQSKTTTAQ